jgi:hypothetical protein
MARRGFTLGWTARVVAVARCHALDRNASQGGNTRDVPGLQAFYGSVFGSTTLAVDGAEMWTLPGYGDYLERDNVLFAFSTRRRCRWGSWFGDDGGLGGFVMVMFPFSCSGARPGRAHADEVARECFSIYGWRVDDLDE